MYNSYSQENPLYFLHIPKTAGTTLITYLHSQFEPDAICPAYLWSELLKIPSDKLTGYRLFRGHFYHYIDHFLQQELTYMTFLRNPIERSISHYQHILRDPYHYLHDKAVSQPILAAFLSDPNTIPMIANFQTRSLAYDVDPVAIATTLDQSALDKLVLEQVIESIMPTDISDQDLLQRAKERLDRFAFVGIVEQFEESNLMLAQRFGWNNPEDTPFLNVAQNRMTTRDIPGGTLQLLNKHVALDQELYQYGKELFEKQRLRINTRTYTLPEQYPSDSHSTTKDRSANQPTCSVIINTYNRAPYLRRLLAGLRHLHGARFEVIIVNGPSTDGTAALLAEYQGRVKVVDCPTRNLSHSRNLGIAAAAGDIIVFIDDDALPGDADWLAHYVEAFDTDTTGSLGAAGGPVWHKDSKYYEFNGGAISDYGFQIFEHQRASEMVAASDHWVAGVRGCNCAFRRTALLEIGGFDEFYSYYLDESDVCMRLAQAGFTIAHLPKNTVRHYSGASEHRATDIDRNWRVIARSDTYYALKNGIDPRPRRLLKTIAAAPRKHYIGEINHSVVHGGASAWKWARAMRQWIAGVYDGLRAGLAQPRRLGMFQSPPALLGFTAPAPERPLRIALLTQSIPGQPGSGGIGRYTLDLAQGLHERGHQVHIICKDEQPLHYQSLGFLIHGIPHKEYAPRSLFDNRPVLNKNLSYGLAVAQQLAQLRQEGIVFDLVHASNWDAEAAAIIRAQLYPTLLMLVSPLAQVIAAEGWPIDDDLRACVALDRWQIDHADMTCVPSEGVLHSYQALMGISRDSLPNLRIAPLGIVPALAVAPDPVAHPRRLLFVGRCERRKGAHILLEVLPRLLTEYTQWECHLVGDDSVPVEGSTLKHRFLARHRGAPWLDRVIFHGVVAEAELQRQYQQCDLFVAPSLFESFGLIYHEAMQYGKAVVGCRTGGVSEVVTHGVEGLLVEPGNADQLYSALVQLMNDDRLRERMGAAGAQRIHQQQNYRTMAAQMEALYLELIAAQNECTTQPA